MTTRWWSGEIFGGTGGHSRQQRRLTLFSIPLLSLALIFVSGCRHQPSASAQYPAPPPPAPAQGAQVPSAPLTPDQLQQLVAPIALYPDSLVAQILAASTFPEQVVEANRFLQSHPDLKDKALADAVNQQPWDASVKGLTAFPSVLGNMDKNLSWTSSLGDAYYNQQQNVMDAVQVMRQHAQQAGNLKSTPQQSVSNDGSDIVVQPANPQVVYVPAYNPWNVYGYDVPAWPGWYDYPGIWFGGPYLDFGLGFGMGYFGGFGWGWNNWGCDWHNRGLMFGHNRYFSNSRTSFNRSNYYRGGGAGRGGGVGRGGAFNRSGAARPFGGNSRAARGFAGSRGQSGMRSGAFSNYGHGGEARGFSSRGSSSFGGGHGGGFGGGGHGGGFGGGGHR